MRTDDITRAVLARDDVAKYLQGASSAQTRQQIEEYLGELRTTQRYRFYRALQHPLYPILRKVERITEHVEIAKEATARGHVVYVSNHKSHIDWMVEPLVLDDHGVRPPLTVAGINLFGGMAGLLHRHVLGAIPVRRNSKDPIYLVTFKAYIAELLKRRDVLYYSEGGRSYSGELKAPKTGLLRAALDSDRDQLSIVPMAVAYDLVLEDRMLARQAIKRRHKPFSKEIAEMVGQAVGYRTRAFVTFGTPIPLGDFDPGDRRSIVTLARRVQNAIGQLYKVLPTALVAAVMRPSTTRADVAARIDALLPVLAAQGANLDARSGRDAAEAGIALLAERGVIVETGGRIRVRDRMVLRYYARTIRHLLVRDEETAH